MNEIMVEQAAAEVRAKLNARAHFFRNRQKRKTVTAQAAIRRARRRARTEAYLSCGMTRTRNGQWE